MHGLAVYVKEGLPFARVLSLENFADSYLRFQLALRHSLSYFFFFYLSPSSSLCTVFESILSNIDEVFSIKPSANVFIFGELSSDARICCTMAFPPLVNSDHVVVSVSNDFPINSKREPRFIVKLIDWDGLRDHLRDVPREDIFKLSASAAASKFCEWVQVGIDVYIPHRMYQVKPHSFPWLSVACAATIVLRNHFFR